MRRKLSLISLFVFVSIVSSIYIVHVALAAIDSGSVSTYCTANANYYGANARSNHSRNIHWYALPGIYSKVHESVFWETVGGGTIAYPYQDVSSGMVYSGSDSSSYYHYKSPLYGNHGVSVNAMTKYCPLLNLYTVEGTSHSNSAIYTY